MVTVYGYLGTYATPLHPYLPPGAMGSSGVCDRSMLTGTGVLGSSFRFVSHGLTLSRLELQVRSSASATRLNAQTESEIQHKHSHLSHVLILCTVLCSYFF